MLQTRTNAHSYLPTPFIYVIGLVNLVTSHFMPNQVRRNLGALL